MDREQIMKLDGEGLRLAIGALKYGAQWWSIHPPEDYKGVGHPCSGGHEVLLPDKDGDMPAIGYWEDDCYCGVPNWPGDIAAAVSLLDEYPEWVLSRYPESYRCVIYQADPDLHIVGEVFDPDKCKAASRAWLLAHEA